MKMSLTGSFLGCVHFRLRITTEPILNTDQDKLPDVSNSGTNPSMVLVFSTHDPCWDTY